MYIYLVSFLDYQISVLINNLHKINVLNPVLFAYNWLTNFVSQVGPNIGVHASIGSTELEGSTINGLHMNFN